MVNNHGFKSIIFQAYEQAGRSSKLHTLSVDTYLILWRAPTERLQFIPADRNPPKPAPIASIIAISILQNLSKQKCN
ncbi:MAG TPA: hypothetical protein VLC79_05830, partial [Cellvibrio sp.]|nr:hypothetical protein [Cellvibrio sp.]